MNDHFREVRNMISDTPISDSTAHNIAELGMLCRRLERKLAATRKYLSEVSERARKLETENDAMRADLLLWSEDKWRE